MTKQTKQFVMIGESSPIFDEIMDIMYSTDSEGNSVNRAGDHSFHYDEKMIEADEQAIRRMKRFAITVAIGGAAAIAYKKRKKIGKFVTKIKQKFRKE